MTERCYNCGIELTKENRTAEHIPAQNLYVGFDSSYKQDRITVPSCFACNNGLSHIDAEIRDLIGIGNNDMTKESVVTQKAVRSIMRKSNWKDRAFIDEAGRVIAVNFSYDDLKKLHVKHFKGLFRHQYGIPLPPNFKVEIIADGDEDLTMHGSAFYDLLTSQDETWQISGHPDIFKFIIKSIHLDYTTGKFEKNDGFTKATFVGCIMVYHESQAIVVLAARVEYLEANKGFYGY